MANTLHNVLFDAALVVYFKRAMDGRLSVDRKTNLVTRRRTHPGALTSSQNNRIMWRATAHLLFPLIAFI